MFNFYEKKMKKVSLFGAFILMAVVMFTSCLGEGSNTSSGTLIGVVRFDSEKLFKNVLDVSEYEHLYSVAFGGMVEGDCYFVSYELDMDDPENQSESLQNNGCYTIKVLDKQQITKFNLQSLLTDTTKLLTNEIPVKNPVYGNSSLYIKGKFFLSHQIDEPSDQKTTWNLSYDPTNMVVEENDNRIYDLFIRATNSGTQTKAEKYNTYAYDMGYYLKQVANTEKNLKNEKFYLRFNYVSEIKGDTAIVWKASEKLETSVEMIIPSESSN